MKIDLEIAIDQQTRACDRTFEGVPDRGAHISVRDIRKTDFAQNNRVSIFFHEIFRINVESHFDLKFWDRILS